MKQDIVNDYYKFIINFENYLKKYKILEKSGPLAKKYKKDFIHINDYLNSNFFNWRKIKGDIKNYLINSIVPNNPNIYLLLKEEDGVSTIFHDLAIDDLIKHYENQGVDLSKDEIKDKINDKVFKLTFQKSINSKIYSNKTKELHSILISLKKVCKKLLDIYNYQDLEDADKSIILI